MRNWTKRWATSLAIIFTATCAVADLVASPEDIFQLAAEADVHALERNMAHAQDLYMAGRLTADDMRARISALRSTHPDVIRALNTWVETYPDSAFAHISLAWNLQKRAFLIRGGLPGRQVHAAAHAAFNSQNHVAKDHAQRAYLLNKHLIPASDAMISMPAYIQGMLEPRMILSAVMHHKPNWGSLSRALIAAHPGWGGSPETVEELCDTFGPLIPTEGSIDMVFRCYYYGYAKYYMKGASGWLWSEDDMAALDPELEDLRAELISNPWIKIDRSPEDLAFARQNLLDRDDPWTVYELAKQWDMAAHRSNAMDSYLWEELYSQAAEPALAQLRKDPLDGQVLDFLVEVIKMKGLEPHRISFKGDDDLGQLWRMITERRLVSAPYTADYWLTYSISLSTSFDPSDHALADLAFANAVYYSKERPETLVYYLVELKNRINSWQDYTVLGRAPRSEERKAKRDYIVTLDPDKDVFCPFLRAFRVYEFECKAAPEGIENCTRGTRRSLDYYDYRAMADKIAKRPACASISQASYDDLKFSPNPVSLPNLN